MPKRTKTPAQKPRKQPAKARGRRTVSLAPSWVNAVRDPYNHAPVAIPDDQCQPTCKFSMRATQEFVTTDANVSPGTSHGTWITILPAFPDSASTRGFSWITQAPFNSTNTPPTFGNATAALQNLVVQPPNFGACFPNIPNFGSGSDRSAYMYRVTAMEARVSYAGTELQRAGRVTAGLAEFDSSWGSSGTFAANSFNGQCLTAGVNAASLESNGLTGQQIRNHLRRMAIERVEDGQHIIRWIPFGVPKYVPLANTSNSSSLGYEGMGPIMNIIIENDMTPTASATGNAWLIDVVCHVEVIPASRYVMASGPTPSPYDPAALAMCLNRFQQLSSVGVEHMGISSMAPDGAQSDVGNAFESVLKFGKSAGEYAFAGAQMAADAARTDTGRAVLNFAARSALPYFARRRLPTLTDR